ncbi:YopX family protein [Bacillus safensis]|uniref:YopX family protein n=1 Tax=Bacillus TaxID=1386 RepID=UPI001B55A95B|nr:YopX family protein [Bacillus safensis]MEC1118513.1 YopX family protein [Bacillus safensis]
MREIKFQAWVIQHKLSSSNMHWAGIDSYEEIIDVHDISFDNGKIDYVTDKDGDEYSLADKSLKAVRRYTGLKDKNGREIYEGDIVRGSLRLHEDVDPIMRKVCMHNGCYMFGVWNAHEYFNKHQHIEVVGNIYQNPELLKTEGE